MYHSGAYSSYRQSNSHRCEQYSHQRVQQILHWDYHCTMQPINGGYKENRRKGYVKKYHLINNDTGEILAERITMNAMRIILTEEGYPLHPSVEELERMKEYKKTIPNQGAIAFLAFVEKQKKLKK